MADVTTANTTAADAGAGAVLFESLRSLVSRVSTSVDATRLASKLREMASAADARAAELYEIEQRDLQPAARRKAFDARLRWGYASEADVRAEIRNRQDLNTFYIIRPAVDLHTAIQDQQKMEQEQKQQQALTNQQTPQPQPSPFDPATPTPTMSQLSQKHSMDTAPTSASAIAPSFWPWAIPPTPYLFEQPSSTFGFPYPCLLSPERRAAVVSCMTSCGFREAPPPSLYPLSAQWLTAPSCGVGFIKLDEHGLDINRDTSTELWSGLTDPNQHWNVVTELPINSIQTTTTTTT